jgi:hypothetical protein
MEVQWEFEFDNEILVCLPELKTHPVVDEKPLNTRDALFGGRTETMLHHYKKGKLFSIVTSCRYIPIFENISSLQWDTLYFMWERPVKTYR